MIKPQNNNTSRLVNNKLVKEKSKQNNWIGKKDIIWNCSNGVINIDNIVCIVNINLFLYWDKRTWTYKSSHQKREPYQFGYTPEVIFLFIKKDSIIPVTGIKIIKNIK